MPSVSSSQTHNPDYRSAQPHMTKILCWRNLFLDPLGGPQQRVIRGQSCTALGTRKAARPDVVVILANPAVRVLDLEALKGVGEDTVARGEEGVLEGLLGGEALRGVVFEEAGEEFVPFRAEGG